MHRLRPPTSFRRARAWVLAALGSRGLVGCVDTNVIPEPPAADELEEAYAEATGVLSAAEVQEVIDDFSAGEPVERAFDDQAYADGVVSATAHLSDGSGELQLGRIRFAGQAVLDISRPCEANGQRSGYFQGRVTFTLSGLTPVLWGELEDCVRVTTRGPATFTGDFIIVLDRVDGFQIDPEYWTARFDGSLSRGDSPDAGVVVDGVFDAQRRGGELRARVATGDDEWAFLSYREDEPTQLHLIDRETLYSCDLITQTCSTEDPP